MYPTFFLLSFFLLSQAIASDCPHDEKNGLELVKRVYAAETFRHGPLGKPYTESLTELAYNTDGLENNCDIKNWDIIIKVQGKDQFRAVVKSKITKKSLIVDQNKNLTRE